jgi:hypothetical protein
VTIAPQPVRGTACEQGLCSGGVSGIVASSGRSLDARRLW